ncbi:hypothetical protein Tco_0871412 [Tanacetum coccineum]
MSTVHSFHLDDVVKPAENIRGSRDVLSFMHLRYCLYISMKVPIMFGLVVIICSILAEGYGSEWLSLQTSVVFMYAKGKLSLLTETAWRSKEMTWEISNIDDGFGVTDAGIYGEEFSEELSGVLIYFAVLFGEGLSEEEFKCGGDFEDEKYEGDDV